MNKICTKCSQDSQLYTLQKCKHIFCYKCLYEYVNKLESCKIKCPFESCIKVLSDKDIRKFLSTYHTEKYDKLQFSQGTIHKCLTKNCPFIYIPDGDLIFHCEYCEQPNCTKCKIRHYPDECKNNENHEEIREQNAQFAIRQRKRKEIEAYDFQSDLVPNFDGFECPICFSFFLPKTQVILRTCQHEFCVDCLKSSLESKKIDQLRCPGSNCDTLLTSVEERKLVGKRTMDSLNISLIQPKVYKCKYPNCSGFWDCDFEKQNEFKCPICENTNCVSCGTVHEKGETCLQYKNSKKYIYEQKELEKLKAKSITCICKKILIHGGGCGALYCDNCSRHICLFTGKLAGQRLPEGCGCSKMKTCHVDCKYGCFPE